MFPEELLPEFLRDYKILVKYNHLHIITEKKPMSLKLQKDFWIRNLLSKNKFKRIKFPN